MKSRTLRFVTALTLFTSLATPAWLAAQDQEDHSVIAGVAANPVPLINQPLVPDAIRPGAAGFTLTVNGTGFVLGSVVRWNGSPRATTFVSWSRLRADIPTSDVARPGTISVTVTSPAPDGGTSNAVFFEVTGPASSVSMRGSAFAAGTNSISVVTGDFNRDGKLDLAVANFQGDNTISILLGNGDGTFRPAVNYSVGSGPGEVATGDFNDDGKLDLAVTDGSGVSILLGNGDGTLRSAVSYTAGPSPSWVAVGDFNGDGKLDLAVTNSTDSGGVSVLLGNGDGTFQPAVSYSVGSGPTGLAVGDFNGDGKLDLAVECRLRLGKSEPYPALTGLTWRLVVIKPRVYTISVILSLAWSKLSRTSFTSSNSL